MPSTATHVQWQWGAIVYICHGPWKLLGRARKRKKPAQSLWKARRSSPLLQGRRHSPRILERGGRSTDASASDPGWALLCRDSAQLPENAIAPRSRIALSMSSSTGIAQAVAHAVPVPAELENMLPGAIMHAARQGCQEQVRRLDICAGKTCTL